MTQKFKLAAIDLDGTLLGPDCQVSSANAAAVQRLRHAGMHVVLASGRHFKNMRGYAEGLPGVEWIISCQGGELSNLDRTEILEAHFLPGARAREAFELGASLGFTMVAYTVDGVLTDSAWNSELKFYTELAGRQPIQVPARELFDREIFKLIWMGGPSEIERTARRSPVQPAVIQMVRTHARFLELMPVGVSKGSTLKTLARRLGVEASESIAFGDGDNDVPMFDWAGISVAMAHGWPSALRHADYTAPDGPADTALARAVDLALAPDQSQGDGEKAELVARA